MTTPVHPAAAAGRLPLLDGLRTMAALGVGLYHIHDSLGLTRLFTHGYVLVDLFFLLSGFVLTLAFEPRFAGGMGAGAFMGLRIRRIWPLAALACLFGALSFLPEAPVAEILLLLITGLLMMPNLDPRFQLYPLSGVQWSLLWELLANWAHVAVLRRLTDRALVALVAAGGIVLAVSVLTLGSANLGASVQYGIFALPRVLWSYGLGILMARRWSRAGAAAGNGGVDWRIALLAPFAVAGLLGWLPLTYGQIDALAVLVLMPALFWLAVHAAAPARHGPALIRFGQISFPFYALHVPFITMFEMIDDSLRGDLAALAAALAGSCMIAWRWPQLAGMPRSRPIAAT